MSNEEKVEKLFAFKRRDKFSEGCWNKRGLHPSDDELCQKLNFQFDDTADQLIRILNENSSLREIKVTLKRCLKNFRQTNFDTEEREFICDLFVELSEIINVNFSDELNKWLYGTFINTLLKLSKIFNPEKVVETIRTSCRNCNIDLETFIVKSEKGIPDYEWVVVTCKNCNEYNLLSLGPNRKRTQFGNYNFVEQLSKEEFTEEQAMQRMEQIKYFRK